MIVFLLIICEFVWCQESELIRWENDFGFKISSLGDKFVIQDSLDRLAVKDTFDFVTLEPVNNWCKKRNSFVCKKEKEFYLISSDCRNRMKFDSIKVIENGYYICNDKSGYRFVNDSFQILYDSLACLEPLSRMSGRYLFKKDDVCGILDETDILVKLDIDSIVDIHSWKYIGIVADGKMGIFDYAENKIILKPIYDYIFESHIHTNKEKQRFLVLNNDKFNIINKRGKTLTGYGFDQVTTWVEYGPNGHYILHNGKIGIIDYDGNEVILPIYEELFYCSSGIYKAVKENRFGVIGKNKKILLPFIYDSIIVDDFRLGTSEEKFIYALKENIWRKFNFSGRIVSENCNDCEFIKNLASFQINHYGFEYVKELMISKDDLLNQAK